MQTNCDILRLACPELKNHPVLLKLDRELEEIDWVLQNWKKGPRHEEAVNSHLARNYQNDSRYLPDLYQRQADITKLITKLSLLIISKEHLEDSNLAMQSLFES